MYFQKQVHGALFQHLNDRSGVLPEYHGGPGRMELVSKRSRIPYLEMVKKKSYVERQQMLLMLNDRMEEKMHVSMNPHVAFLEMVKKKSHVERQQTADHIEEESALMNRKVSRSLILILRLERVMIDHLTCFFFKYVKIV